MTDQDDQHDVAPGGPPSDADRDPFEEEVTEAQAPRRAASAEFVLETSVGSEAALRDAMDPANQSLADALRLSYRLLQVVMVVLVALFLVSGVQQVEDNHGGVKLGNGKIADAVVPGFQMTLPYPLGELITFKLTDRRVVINEAFWPAVRPGQTFEDAVEQARTRTGLRLSPGLIDGSLMTRQGDLVHMQLTVDYEIDDASQFVQQIELDLADTIVRECAQRAAVSLVAGLTMADVVDNREGLEEPLARATQQMLDDINLGVSIEGVRVTRTSPPLAVVKSFAAGQQAEVEAQANISLAVKEAQDRLIKAAGPNYNELAQLIEQYQVVADSDDVAGAEQALADINDFLESDRTGGNLTERIERAQSYESQIEATYGADAKRFEAMYASYQRQPEIVVKRLWMEAYSEVVTRSDVEVFRVPQGLKTLLVKIWGQERIQRIRNKNDMDLRERDASRAAGENRLGSDIQRAEDFTPGTSNPLMEVDDEGNVKARGSGG